AQQTKVFLEDVVLTDIPPAGAGAGIHDGASAQPPAPGGLGDGAGNGSGEPVQPAGVSQGVISPTATVISAQAAPSSNGAKSPAFSYTSPLALDNTTVDAVVRSKVWNERDLSAYATLQQWSLQDVLTSTATQYQNSAVGTTMAAEDATGIFALR